MDSEKEVFAPIIIGCRSLGYPNPGDERPATLSLTAVDATLSRATFLYRIHVEEIIIEARFITHGFYLQKFIDAIFVAHQALSGSARLFDQDDDIIMCVSIIDSSRGLVAIGGSVRQAVFHTEVMSEDQLVTGEFRSGIRTTFEGFQTDQSHLPKLVHSLQEFLRISQLSTTNPLE